MWRTTTEVEVCPHKLLKVILNERYNWDPQLLKIKVLEKLDDKSEVLQYACGYGQNITDYCVLR